MLSRATSRLLSQRRWWRARDHSPRFPVSRLKSGEAKWLPEVVAPLVPPPLRTSLSKPVTTAFSSLPVGSWEEANLSGPLKCPFFWLGVDYLSERFHRGGDNYMRPSCESSASRNNPCNTQRSQDSNSCFKAWMIK